VAAHWYHMEFMLLLQEHLVLEHLLGANYVHAERGVGFRPSARFNELYW
jgi:hypothetical protein